MYNLDTWQELEIEDLGPEFMAEIIILLDYLYGLFRFLGYY